MPVRCLQPCAGLMVPVAQMETCAWEMLSAFRVKPCPLNTIHLPIFPCLLAGFLDMPLKKAPERGGDVFYVSRCKYPNLGHAEWRHKQKACLQPPPRHLCPLLAHHWENSFIFPLPLKTPKHRFTLKCLEYSSRTGLGVKLP